MNKANYKVSIWTSVFVDAKDESDALDIAHDMVANQQIKTREYEFDVEEWDEVQE